MVALVWLVHGGQQGRGRAQESSWGEKAALKPQNTGPLLEAEARQAGSRSEGQVLAAVLAQPQGMWQLPVSCGLRPHAEPWLADTAAGQRELP